MHKRKLITSVIIIASSLFFGQCERNSLYINSSDALSFFGMDYLFAFSQVNVRVGRIDYPNGSAYNFGTLHEFNSSPAVVFTIQNTGADNLALTGAPALINVTGSEAADFTVTDPAVTLLAPGASTAFTVTFTPGAAGFRDALISIPYNSGDDSSYNLNLTGVGSAAAVPAIYMETGGGYYAPGGNYDFGIVTQGGSSAPITFTVRNAGDAVLTLVPVPWSDNSVFSVSAPGTGSIAGNSTTTFTVTFSPTAVGPVSAVLMISSNDPDIANYAINLSGTGTPVIVPEIDVQNSGISYAVNDTFTFPGVPVSGTSGNLDFTIENTGTGDLNVSGYSLGGANVSEFTVLGLGAAVIPVLGDIPFTISFHPTAAGLRTAELTIFSDDPDEDPYTVYLEGDGTVPEINLLISGTPYSTGATYNFGEKLIKGASTPLTFTIENLGTGSLALTGTPYVIGGGANAGDLVVSGPSTDTIASLSSTTFTVDFVPTATGPRTATITIPNTDSDEGPYVINLIAAGVMPVMVVNGNNSNYTSIYNPITNTFSAGNPVAGNVGRGGHSFFIKTGYSYPLEGCHLVLHGNTSTANSIYNPSLQNFTLNARTVTNPVGSDAHSFEVTSGPYTDSFLIVTGNNVTTTTYYDQLANDFFNGPGIVATGAPWWGSFHLPVDGGDILVVCGNGTLYTSLFSQSGNSFNTGPNIAPTANVSSGGHGFRITGGTNNGRWLVIPGGGFNFTRLYNPATAAFSLGPNLSAVASTGAFSIPITSGTNAGRALILHGNNTLLTSVYNTDGTIEPGPSFTDGDIGIGAFSFLITGGAHNGRFMIIHGGTATAGVGTTVTTIFDQDTLNFITGTGDDLPNQAGSGGHCFPAR